MIKNCIICKKEFYTRPSSVKRNRGKYCSHKCMGEHRKILYKGRQGFPHTEESKKKISLANKGKPSPWKGKHPTEETRALMRQNHADIKGSKNPNWKGGRKVWNCRGRFYILIYKPNHPYATKNYIYEHRYVMECKLGRFLKPTEIIHHIDGDSLNNKISNLMYFPNHSSHLKFHHQANVIFRT